MLAIHPTYAIPAASLTSTFSVTTHGDLPPSSNETRLNVFAPMVWINRPTAVEPVNAILLTSGCSHRDAPADFPYPGRMLITPGGKPASCTRLATYNADSWTSGEINKVNNHDRDQTYRCLFGRLEDARIAGRQCRPEFPCQHEQWIVPWNDLSTNADRLHSRETVNAPVRRND